MCRLDFERSVLILCLTIPALIAGCDRQAAKGTPDVDPNTPEARFDRIMESFRRKIEGQPVGFVVTEGGSRTMMSGTNKVTSQVIPPETPGGRYKAVVTVATESRYSVRRTKTSEDSDREKNNPKQSSSALDNPREKKGVSILEPGLEASARTPSAPSVPNPNQAPEEVVTRRPNEDTRKYELSYENGRWILVTKPDPKTEQSIEFAFSEALARQ